MVVIDLIIVGFACISLIAFTATKDDHKQKEPSKIQNSEQQK
tara:strand:- start:435 stop:560 length:126 start_codon:yes stop_codon:yes gene_type:complete